MENYCSFNTKNYKELIGKNVVILSSYKTGAIEDIKLVEHKGVVLAVSIDTINIKESTGVFGIPINRILSIYIADHSMPAKPATQRLIDEIEMYALGYNAIIIHPKFADRLVEEGALTSSKLGDSYSYFYNKVAVFVSASHLNEEEIVVL